ncbi:malectin domain-containing carbohydrate-binding protein, partial [Mangrovimonas aestuarii]|uniref:malectin domain-containing carbohydrate-binding protein n=1 Tax=Mangrovimonas aestuarii TaxID=3018443 RepID=UPI00237869E5
MDFYLSVDPAANTVQPYYSLDGGQTLNVLGSPIGLPSSFLDPSDSKGLAVGIISTSRGNSGPTPFTATWDLIEVYENQNGVLSIAPDPLEFGLTPTSNSLRTKYIDLNNEGGPTDSPITVTEIAFSGGDASYFSHSAELPIVVNPGTSVKVPINFISTEDIGLKSASLSVTHNGSNSPNSITVMGELTSLFSPIVRINAGGPEVIANDGGPIWEDNAALGGAVGPSYNVSSGGPYSINASDMVFANRDASIPDYIDETTYTSVMNYERGVDITSFPMVFSVLLPNGEYIVNLYFANLYQGTQDPGQRIFSVNIENEVAVDHLDPSAIYGHRIAGMVQYNATVTDGILEIEFIRHINNPLVNAIEIMALQIPPSSEELSATPNPLDFGLTQTSSSVKTLPITLSHSGAPTDSPITVSDITFSGNDPSFFSHSANLPLVIDPGVSVEVPVNFTPSNDLGFKSADLTVVHSGTNSPTVIQVLGELTDQLTPIIRINAGGPEVTATDGGPNWEGNTASGAVSGTDYSVTSGGSFTINGTDLVYADRDPSIPDYIDETTYTTVMNSERSVGISSPPMVFSIPIPNGDYLVNLYFNNLYHGTSEPGQRIFSVDVEGQTILSDFDIAATFGHRIAGLVQYNATVSDGILDI